MSCRISRVLSCTLLLLAIAVAPAAAQADLAAPRITGIPRDGDRVLAGQLPASTSTNLVAVRIDLTDTATTTLTPTVEGSAFTASLHTLLRAGQTVDVRYFANGGWSPWSDAVYVQPRAPSDLLYSYDDDDNPFEVAAFIGASMDQFASAEDRAAAGLGSDANGVNVNTHVHMTAGFEMGYRLIGHAHSERQWWVFSRAIYAVRSGEDLCTSAAAEPQFPCVLRQSGSDALPALSRIIQDAHSFETISGVRFDIATLQAASQTPVKWYAFGQAGAILLEGADSAKNQWTVGMGLRIPEGSFKETRVEVGPGRSEVFASHPWPRWKVHGFLAFPIAGSVRGYAEIRTDADVPSFRTISLFTVLGVHYEIGDLVKK
ncbi:MAG TPA: hypothetical protein VFB07_02590 [Vicinamibacterales bacterium]|nr:hypothetical protein [Vicinamibacterales bacterium]